MEQFKNEASDSVRYLIASRIINLCVDNDGEFVLNLPYDIRDKALCNMDNMTLKTLRLDYFDEIEQEILSTIKQNHWFKFVYHVKSKQ